MTAHHFGGTEGSHREPNQLNWGKGRDDVVARFQCTLSGPVCMLENPVTITIQLEGFMLNVLPQMSHNKVLGVNNLTLGDEFSVQCTTSLI